MKHQRLGLPYSHLGEVSGVTAVTLLIMLLKYFAEQFKGRKIYLDLRFNKVQLITSRTAEHVAAAYCLPLAEKQRQMNVDTQMGFSISHWH